jgi:hypothetical protein
MLLSFGALFGSMMVGAIWFTNYFFVFFILGFVLSACIMGSSFIYGKLHYIDFWNINTSIQYRDMPSSNVDIIVKEVERRVGIYCDRHGTFECYAFKDIYDDEWLIFMRNTLGKLLVLSQPYLCFADRIMATIRTVWLTAVELKNERRALSDSEIKQPGWWARLRHAPPPATTKPVRILYAYCNDEEGHAILKEYDTSGALTIDYRKAPLPETVDKAWKSYTWSSLWALADDNTKKDQLINDLKQMGNDTTALQIELGNIDKKELPSDTWTWKRTITIAAGIVALALAGILVIWWVGGL